MELLAGGAALFVVAMLFGDVARLHLAEVPRFSWLGFGWFILIAIVGFTAFGFLTKAVAPAIATTFSYVNPLVAILLGWLLYGEPITMRMAVATATIVIGVCLIVSTKPAAPGKVRTRLPQGTAIGRCFRTRPHCALLIYGVGDPKVRPSAGRN